MGAAALAVMSVLFAATSVFAEEKSQTESTKELIPLPPFLEGLIRKDCFEKFQQFDFSDIECIKFSISKGIGLAIVVGASILKIPQIIKIL